MKKEWLEKYGNIQTIGIVFFILASVFCLFKIYDLKEQPTPTFITTLKILNVIGRHGDRAPAEPFPKGDKHANKLNFFWPDGFGNLTQVGRWRQFRIGLELRRRYQNFLSYNSSHYLAFSSPVYRCHESLNQTLQGLFDIDWTSEMGRKLVDKYNKNNTSLDLPSGSGSPEDYKNILIDINTVPTLTEKYLNSCKYRLDHPSNVDSNLKNSKLIASMKGLESFMDLMKRNYNAGLDGNVTDLWSTINNEIHLARTQDSLQYMDHYRAWINQRVPVYIKSKITYFDLLEQLTVLTYLERVQETARKIQLSPIITSIIQSQKRAINSSDEFDLPKKITNMDESKKSNNGKNFDLMDLYADKKAIFFSTHDMVMHLLMNYLNMTYIDSGDFETRFNKWHNSDDVDKFLGGFKQPNYGMSLIFELYETEKREKDNGMWKTTKRFYYLKAALYNQDDGKYKPIDYKRLELGAMCRTKFDKVHYKSKRNVEHLLREFYDDDFVLDKYSCPFGLFRNITSDFMMSSNELSRLCE